MSDPATEPATDPATEPASGEAPERRPLRVAFAVLIACTVLVALVSFALSFYGLNDYGRQVMKLPIWLSPLVPVGVDLFSLCGIAATYMLRTAPARVRIYAWAVFLVPTGLSVAGNLAHAVHRELTYAGWAGAAVVPVILALATHLVVVVRRHLENDHANGTDPAAGIMPGYTAFTQVTPAEQALPNGLNGRGNDQPNDTESDTIQIRALQLLLADKQVSEVATELGVDRRRVQRWADKIHERARPGRGGGRRTPLGPGGNDN